MNRRIFLQAAAGFGALILLPKMAYAKALKLVDVTGKTRTDGDNKAAMGQIKGLNYVPDVKKASADKAIAKKYMDKGGVKMAAQTCDDCMFFTCVTGDKTAGKCILFPTVLVDAKGSCTSWSKMPKPKACVANS